jgi:mxaA protein
MKRARLILVLLLLTPPLATAAESVISVSEPRSFGYFLGDSLRRDVLIRVGAGDKLDVGSLPRPGPLNYWLELVSADLLEGRDGDAKTYRLALVYQTFYAPLDTRRLSIPAFHLKVTGTPDFGLTVPEFGFVTSPIRQLFADKGQSSDTATKLQADASVPRLVTGTERTALLVAGLTSIAALVALAWHNAWWPFRRPASRPFTEAARFLEGGRARLQNANGYRTALLKLHRAFDLAAGQRVLADDVDGFLAAHPEFEPYRSDVERLFASSRRAFFANDIERARAEMPLPDIADLSARLGAAERRAAA